ncbi:hypothetical protein A2X44_00765 [candidate division CPR3 bacterium GWF2_35_18]|uniref:Uncharacterized protein n=1 Tax=candidate division CPR3 bacterium GW2011_GWF2_35_18 TaxID=1618350 RepID=A0A0G0C2F0_UNCC3|nr:MAG: hypothetical protein UR67_C0001G0135 [candidate division CPR3 bacterium GW2011_GWF2_35_18]OGB63442.1 MAG: hypothetical protein A2X44_00765 [candidate division CPR3 bacterium GWF2_35_18]OGB64813.1 MAG: hypothetical protein A2250_05265 [candidate division CPR3 bacterium RIFOXYA2_FULL_35_13]OGB78559.1 MAG: hypothetical protein A2296_01365 [candidate division CPR3 bacterium RIFOXYB2_FULL_35_8]
MFEVAVKDRQQLDLKVGRECRDLTYPEMLEASSRLLKSFDEFLSSGNNDPEQLRSFVTEAQTLDDIRRQFFDNLEEDQRKRMDQLFPDRGEIFNSINSVEYGALDRIPFEDLTSGEIEAYLQSMAKFHEEKYGEHNGGYYYFGWPQLYFEIPEDRKLLDAICEDRDLVLTDREANILYEGEKDTYKVHLDVPPERKIEVLKAILAVQAEDNKIVHEIFTEKKAKGGRIIATRKEIQERGGRLSSLNQYKMWDFQGDNPYFADFVFYPTTTQGQTAEEAVIEMVHELTGVLQYLDLPETDRVPRFSTPVIMNGRAIPGMTYVQGNGDFKLSLLKDSGERLGQYYDRDYNWAVRKGKAINFDQKL